MCGIDRSTMFINLSNHVSKDWDEVQIESARKYGEIVDIGFPDVDPSGDSEYFDCLSNEYVCKILDLGGQNPVVMVQGEFVFTNRVVTKLKELGIKCVAAETKRKVKEGMDNNGQRVKMSMFKFEQFMEY